MGKNLRKEEVADRLACSANSIKSRAFRRRHGLSDGFRKGGIRFWDEDEIEALIQTWRSAPPPDVPDLPLHLFRLRDWWSLGEEERRLWLASVAHIPKNLLRVRNDLSEEERRHWFNFLSQHIVTPKG